MNFKCCSHEQSIGRVVVEAGPSLWVSRFPSYAHTGPVRDSCVHLAQWIQVSIHSIQVPLVLTDNMPTTFW